MICAEADETTTQANNNAASMRGMAKLPSSGNELRTCRVCFSTPSGWCAEAHRTQKAGVGSLRTRAQITARDAGLTTTIRKCADRVVPAIVPVFPAFFA